METIKACDNPAPWRLFVRKHAEAIFTVIMCSVVLYFGPLEQRWLFFWFLAVPAAVIGVLLLIPFIIRLFVFLLLAGLGLALARVALWGFGF